MAKLQYTSIVESASGNIAKNVSGRVFNGKNFSYRWDPDKHPFRPTLLRQIHHESLRLTNIDVKAILQDSEQSELYRSQALAAHHTTGLRNFIFHQRFAVHKQDLLARFANDEPAFAAYLATHQK